MAVTDDASPTTAIGELSVSIRGLDVKYRVYEEQRLSVRELVGRGFRDPRSVEVHAIRDLDLEDLAVLGAGERHEGQTAAGAVTLAFGQVKDLFNGGQAGVIAAFGPGLAGLLAARLLGRGGRGRLGAGSAGLALFAEELLLAQTQLGTQGQDLGVEIGVAGEGLGVAHRTADTLFEIAQALHQAGCGDGLPIGGADIFDDSVDDLAALFVGDEDLVSCLLGAHVR